MFSDKYRDPVRYHEFAKKYGRETLAMQIAELCTKYIPIDPANASRPRLLDLAAGTGIISTELAKQGYDVIAADINPSMLELLRQLHPDIHAVETDFNNPFPFDTGQFDGITTFGGNRYITKEGLPIFMSEVYRTLKENGAFVWSMLPIEGPFWKLRSGIDQPTSTYTLSRLLRENGFKDTYIDRSQFFHNLTHTPTTVIRTPFYLIARK